MKRLFCRAIFAICLGVSGLAHAATIEVDPTGSNDCTNNPPCDLQTALDFAKTNPGDDILHLGFGTYDASLATFTYTPGATESGALTLNGTGAVIDGGGDTGQAGLAIDMTGLTSDASSNVVVANITFRNGSTSTVDAAGLSVNVRDANVNIHHCSFTNNENTGSGAGGLNIGRNGTVGSVIVAKNNFSGNRTNGVGGGALIATEGSLSILGNTFANNQALDGGAGGGLGIECEGDVFLDGNKFQDNIAESGGGGAFVEAENESGGSVVFTNNIFVGNNSDSTHADPIGEGGGAVNLFTEGGEVTFTNNTFVNNRVVGGNAGALKFFLDPEGFLGPTHFYNNIFFNNTASGSTCPGACGDIFVDDNGDANQVVSGPEVNVFNNLYSEISFSCNLSDGCVPHQNVDVETNVDADPLFVNVSNGDLRLAQGSPAIDAGSAAAPHLPSVDFQGSTRVQGGKPDMGALESTPASSPPPGPENCANNVDDDGDTKIDCNDPDCAGAAACQGGPVSPATENCANGADDDQDNAVDCDDPDCSGAFACRDEQSPSVPTENCANDLDDDGDGNIDCNDPDCSGAAACRTQTGGAGGGGSSSTVVTSGCSMGLGTGNPSSALWLLAPLLLASIRRIRRLKLKGLTFLLFAAFFLSLSIPSHARDLEVTSSPDNDCSDNFCDLQTALDEAAGNGEDDVLTLDGGTYDSSGGQFTYEPSDNHSLLLRADSFSQAVIDGGGANPGLVINTTLHGIDSMADVTVMGITFQNGQSAFSAGGLSIVTDDADIIVRNCNFRFNNSDVPVGGFDFGGGGLSTVTKDLGSVLVTDSVFFRNSVTQSIGGGSLSVSVNGNVSLEGNTYLENTTLNLLGPTTNTICGGAAVVSVVGSLSVNRNLFLDNSSQAGAGLLAVEVFGNGVVTNNIAARNLAAGAISGGGTGIFPSGGGMSIVAVQGKIDVTNNTVVENQSAAEGGGILVIYDSDGGEINLFNNIIRGNLGQAGTVCTTGCDDIVFLDDDDGNNIGSKANVSHNDFGTLFFQCQEDQGCTPNQNVDAASNINADPLFANLGLSNFHLLTGSPAIDKGTASAPSLPAKDFDKKTRNQGGAPDMGALESTPPPPTPPTPPTTENCANNLDDDQDNAVDCSDPDCSGALACRSTTPPPTGPENCTNNKDDDGDTNIDCNDPDCSGSAACQSGTTPPPAGNSENCANGADDDGDTQVDCDDPDCSGAASCLQNDGTGGGSQSPSNVDVNSGCALGAGTGNPSSLFCFLIPLFLAAGRVVRISKSSRGR